MIGDDIRSQAHIGRRICLHPELETESPCTFSVCSSWDYLAQASEQACGSCWHEAGFLRHEGLLPRIALGLGSHLVAGEQLCCLQNWGMQQS